MAEQKPHGKCQVCGRSITLVKTGCVRVHGDKKSWPPMNCAGSGRHPEGHPESLAGEAGTE